MFWNTFVKLCNEHGTTPSAVCSSLGYSSATSTKWKSGSLPRSTTLQKVADYFGCSVEYLLKNHDDIIDSNSKNIVDISHGTVGVIGNSHAPVTVNDDSELSEQEKDLIRIYRNSKGKNQVKIMSYVYNLEDECDE